MRILPVIDLMHGQVVRGVAGRRAEYRPLRSALAASADPLDVARGYRNHFQLHELYIADLDAIKGRPPALATFQALQADGFTLLVDAGLRTLADATALLDSGVAGVVAGLETLSGPNVLADLAKGAGPARLVFSLDLKNGQPLTTAAAWKNHEPSAIAVHAIALGVRRLLVLDLARVGVGTGTGTETLLARLHAAYPEVELLAGGGVRGPEDVERLRQCGVSAVLVASALHDGRLRPEDLPKGTPHK